MRELGYSTIEADSAKPALRNLETEATVDLMLTDIVMPGGMDGRALAGEAAKLRAHLPVIFTSGFPVTADGSLITNWQDEGMQVLAKPVRRRELAERIRNSLDMVA